MKQEILNLLRTREDYVSSKELCDKFGVSRTAIWKAINQLKENGYEIESVTNKGYRLKTTPNVVTAEEIKSQNQAKWIGKEVVFFEEIDSTNARAARLSEEGYPSGTLVVAEEQTAGRGRRGRSWTSPRGKNIYMTLLLKPDINPNHASMLTLVAAVALRAAIERSICDAASENTASENTASEITANEIAASEIATNDVATSTDAVNSLKIKWPNDLVLNGKKISGILTEMSAQIDYINYVIIGMGVNVLETQFPEEFAEHAGSIFTETGLEVKRATLIAYFLEEFEKRYELFLETEDLSAMVEEYNAQTVNREQEVRVLDPKAPFTGIAKGINQNGELLVDTDGEVKPVSSGEVSVRGIYGYV